MPARPPHNPLPLTVAVSLVLVEALVLGLLGVLELFALHDGRLTMGLTTAAFLLGYAAGLAWCAWRVAHRESWARSPVVLAQLLQLGVAWSFRQEPTTWVAVALAVVALLVLLGVFHPASLGALGDEPAPER